MNRLTEPPALRCANCGATLQGEFCHACGQSVHSVLKPVHHMLEDTMDLVLHVDGRILHTLPPLLLRPGFLTLEYFAGRRQRYVAPFRLMFVLALLAFFACHLAVEGHAFTLNIQGAAGLTDPAIRQARTPAQVDAALHAQLARLEQADRQAAAAGVPPGTVLARGRASLEAQARTRRAQLAGADGAGDGAAAGHPAGQAVAAPTEPPARPVRIGWLPAAANARLTRAIAHLKSNAAAFSEGGERGTEARERVIAQVFAVLPQTMFVLLPLFALLLKLVYLFRRRLYMEHLIVALHSHAFLFLALLLYVLLYGTHGWLSAHAGWAAAPFAWLGTLLAWWIPVYLLLMQKRVYRQGWPITLAKYLGVGFCYMLLLTTTLAGGVVWAFAH